MSFPEKVLELFKPLVSQGRTRFLTAMGAMGAVVYLAKDPQVDKVYALGIVIIAAVYIVAKSYVDAKTKEKENGN